MIPLVSLLLGTDGTSLLGNPGALSAGDPEDALDRFLPRSG